MQYTGFWEVQVKCCFTWKVCFGPWMLGREEVNGQVLHLHLLGGVEGEGGVDQGVPEGTVPAEGGQGKGREYVSGGGIFLEVAEMASDNLLDVDDGGMV
eukprot:g16881.t1